MLYLVRLGCAAVAVIAIAALTSIGPYAALASPTFQSEPGRQVSHDGLMLEIVEVERGWQGRMPDGSVFRSRDGQELLTVHVRLLNRASRASVRRRQ